MKTHDEINFATQCEQDRIIQLEDESTFGKHLWNYYEFISWAKWYPDLYVELFKGKDSNRQLHFDQRTFMRADMRFMSMYGTFSRGYAKTYTEMLDDMIAGTLFPNITMSVTAQTRENSAALMEDKYNEILTDFPLFENEIEKVRFSKNDALIQFKGGAKITNLANAQTSKGRRRNRIKIEESALLNNALFEDALAPIVEVGRTTCGSLAIIDPEELNQQIHFFTTSGYRGTDEYNRSVNMVKGMVSCNGEIVLGSDWMLPCYYGRGSTKAQILKKKKTSNPIFFAQNYEQKWVGCADNALVDVNKLMASRILTEPILEMQRETDEFYIAVDVARSENTSNNQSARYVDKGGVMTVTLSYERFNEVTDKLIKLDNGTEAWICDYKSPTTPTLPPSESDNPIISATITGNTNLKIGISRTYTVSFMNGNSKIEASSIDFKWYIKSKFPIEQKVSGEYNENITLKVSDEDYIDDIFELQIIVNESILSKKEITIVDVI